MVVQVKCRRGDVGNYCKTTTIAGLNVNVYTNVAVFLRVLLATPVSSATVEPTFSIRRRQKTNLTATTTTERMPGLALMVIHRGHAIAIKSN